MTNNNNILNERAALLAKPIEKMTLESADSILVFYIDNEKYAINTKYIMRVITANDITFLPGLSSLFAGIIYYDGIIMPVVNGNRFFNIRSDKKNEILIIINQEGTQFGLLVDKVHGKMMYSDTEKLIQLNTDRAKEQKTIEGIYQKDIAIINTSKLLNYLDNQFQTDRG